jgi:hypothetical protein
MSREMEIKLTFKRFSEKGYKHYTDNTIEELDELPLHSLEIITEFAHLREWLRVNYGIWVVVNLDNVHEKGIMFFANVIKSGKHHKSKHRTVFYNNPQEAYSAAFDYILNNLI